MFWTSRECLYKGAVSFVLAAPFSFWDMNNPEKVCSPAWDGAGRMRLRRSRFRPSATYYALSYRCRCPALSFSSCDAAAMTELISPPDWARI